MPATKILNGGTVITFDEASQKIIVLPKASVVIVDDRIDAITTDISSLVVPDDAEVTDCTNKIISPGFVNTHVHMWQTAYRSMGPDITLVHYFDWTSQTSKLSRKFTPEDVYFSALEGYLEGLNAGVTSMVDHATNNWSEGVMKRGFDAAIDSEARIWWCFEPYEWKDYGIQQQWKDFERVSSRCTKNGTVQMGLGYNGLAGAKDDDFEFVKRTIQDTDVKAITIHHLGGPWPSLNSSPEDMVAQNLHKLDIPIILSHAPYLSSEDISCCREHNMHVSLTPESEFHYGHGQTTGHLIPDQASLGIDTNWTFSGDILTQARLWLQHVRNTGFQNHITEAGTLPQNTPFAVEQGFLLATRQGGKALWRDDIGVIKVGAKADLVVFDGDSPNMLGWTNAVAAVMLHANVGDIEHVMVDGKWRKKDLKLVDLEKVRWNEVKRKFIETARRIQGEAFPPPPVTENLWGFKETEEMQEWSTIRKK